MAKVFPPIGMSTNIWGPILWNAMHIVSLGYSETPNDEEKQSAIHFYNSLKSMIPCPICRHHYSLILKDDPVEKAVESRTTLVLWLFNIHNKVNEQLGKPVLSWEKYIEAIYNLSNPSPTTIEFDYTWIIAALAVTGLVGGGYAYYRSLK
jgi:hypothetical protein